MEQIGRYKIVRELGRGAMGVVYAATDPLIGRQVAIKTIRLGSIDLGDNREELTRRLYREAQSAGILSHPGIITIHDIGEQGEDAYIVMEFVDGRSLEGLLASGVPQSSSALLSILRKAAEALDYAHSKGIIHRDIKPANIMICRDGLVKIADFGVAKLTASSSMTQSGLVLGTPSYMSPEQAQGRTIDGRSDQFSLAVVAYRILTGKLPFEAPTLTALLAKILWEEPDYENAGLHPPVLPVFRRALSKDPQLRFPTCAEFVQQLEAAHEPDSTQPLGEITASAPAYQTGQAAAAIPTLSGASGMAQTLPQQPSPLAASGMSPAAGQEKLEQAEPPAEVPKRSRAALAAAAAVLVLAVIAFFAFRMLREPDQPVRIQPSDIPPVRSEPAPPAAALPEKLPQEPAAASPKIEQEKPALEDRRETAAASQAASSQPDSVRTVPAKTASALPKKVEVQEKKSDPAEGVITWKGDLRRNAVLVIGEQASIGTFRGSLPGKPVEIEVEPEEVIVRQRPGPGNGWKLIILYSGTREYSSITVRWRRIR